MSLRGQSPSGYRRLPAALLFLAPMAALIGPAAPSAVAQAPSAVNTAVDSGVTQLPLGGPPTGRQSGVPVPAGAASSASKPTLVSPLLDQVNARLSTAPLNIEDAVALALVTDRNLALSGEALLAAEGKTSEARAALNPNLSGSGTLTQLNQATTVNFGGTNITVVPAFQKALGISATLPIDIAGLLHSATDAARFQEVAARLDVNRARNQLVLDVKSAFYNVLRAQALVSVSRENLEDSMERLHDARVKFSAGVVAKLDVIRAQTDVANGQQQLIQAKSQVSLALASLKSVMGLDINGPISVTDNGAVDNPPGVNAPDLSSADAPLPKALGVGPAEAAPAPPAARPLTVGIVDDPLTLGSDYDSIVREALTTRPEIFQGDADISAARKNIIVAKRSILPSLGLSITGAYQPDAGSFSQTSTATAVLSLAVPIFDGGIARSRVKEATANVATAETNRRLYVDQVELEVRQAYIGLSQARDRVAVANQALSEARESFRLAQVRYRAGVSSQAGISPLLEVSDAQAALTQAESNQVNALYDYNNSRSTLDKAIGRYAFVGAGPGYGAPPSSATVGGTLRDIRK